MKPTQERGEVRNGDWTDNSGNGRRKFITLGVRGDMRHIKSRRAGLEWLRELFPDRMIEAEAIADFGCAAGTGTFGLAWAVDPSTVVGIDKDEHAVSVAGDKVAEIAEVAEVKPEVQALAAVDFEFVCGDMVGGVPLETGTFDVAHCERVLHKIWCEEVQPYDDTLQAIKEMARITKPGGVVIAIEGEWCDPRQAQKRLLLATIFEHEQVKELEKIFVKSRGKLSDERAQSDPSLGDTYVYLYRKRERVEEQQG